MVVANNVRQFAKQLNPIVVVITLLVFFSLIKLGLWQAQRADEKELRLARIAQYTLASPSSIEDIKQLLNNFEEINDIPVKIEADFKSPLMLLDNQPNGKQLGYRVIQPVEVAGDILLVNLGWVAGSIDRSKLPDVRALSGKHQFIGHVRVPEHGIQISEDVIEKFGQVLRIQYLALAKISQETGQKLLPFVVYLDKNELIGFEKNWQPIVMPPEKHRAYSFQWFSLATAWILLMLSAMYFNRAKNNKK